jgi:hypothetical protein
LGFLRGLIALLSDTVVGAAGSFDGHFPLRPTMRRCETRDTLPALLIQGSADTRASGNAGTLRAPPGNYSLPRSVARAHRIVTNSAPAIVTIQNGRQFPFKNAPPAETVSTSK